MKDKKEQPTMLDLVKKKAWKVARRVTLLIERCKIYFFWTFTFFPGISNKEKGKYWNKFVAALRHYHPDFKFFKVIECHKSGQWHFHVLGNIWMDWHLVQRLWEQCGAGKVVFVKELKNSSGVAYYIAKYIGKGLDSHQHHIYSSSPDFCIHSSDYVKWIFKLIDLKIWAEVKNIFDYFNFTEYAKMCGKRKQRHIRVLLQYKDWGFSW